MPTKSEFDAAFKQIEDFILQVGDTVNETHKGTLEENDKPVNYRIVDATDPSYECYYGVTGRMDQDVFNLRYRYDFRYTLWEYIQTEEGKKLLESDNSPTNPREAAATVMKRVSHQDLNRLKFQLHDHISNSNVISEVTEMEEGGIQGFTIYRHLFPFETDFSVSDFYDVLVAVISTGEKGHRYLSNSFAIQIPEEDSETEYSMSFDPDDVF